METVRKRIGPIWVRTSYLILLPERIEADFIVTIRRSPGETEPLSDPDWLAESLDARAALTKLVSQGRNREGILAGLQLLRAEVGGERNTETSFGEGSPVRRPSKRHVNTAVRQFERAKKAVEEVVESFSRLPGFLQSPRRSKIGDPITNPYGVFPSGMSMVSHYLSSVAITLQHLQGLVHRHSLRDVLKAYVVAHAWDHPDSWNDREVSALVNAAVRKSQRTTYTADAHKDWRHRRRDLVEEIKEVVMRELLGRGYVVEYLQKEGPLSPYEAVRAIPRQTEEDDDGL